MASSKKSNGNGSKKTGSKKKASAQKEKPRTVSHKELVKGSKLDVAPDPVDPNFMVVTLRRPRTPLDQESHYEGSQVGPRFAKMCAASLYGMGLMQMRKTATNKDVGVVNLHRLNEIIEESS